MTLIIIQAIDILFTGTWNLLRFMTIAMMVP
jgi:hypothetical protein